MLRPLSIPLPAIDVVNECLLNDKRKAPAFLLLMLIVTHMPHGKASNELDNRLWKIYKETGNEKWLKYLVCRNNTSALEEYFDLCQNSIVLPDKEVSRVSVEVSDAIRSVSRFECLSPVIKLLGIASDPKFKDKTEAGLGLSNSCWEAIINIAKTSFSSTLAILETNKYCGSDLFNERIGD